jgi:hypothetical protein
MIGASKKPLPQHFQWNSPSSSAGFQTCCVADFQIGGTAFAGRPAGLEARDSADLEVCATGPTARRMVPPTENVEEKDSKKTVDKN